MNKLNFKIKNLLLTLVLTLALLLSGTATIFATNHKSTNAFADTDDTVFYFSDTKAVSHAQSFPVSVLNLAGRVFTPEDFNMIFESENYERLFGNEYTYSYGYTVDLTSDELDPCSIYFEFSNTLPVEGFVTVCEDLKELGCNIMVIGAFCEDDLEEGLYQEIVSTVDIFYQKYPEEEFLEYAVEKMVENEGITDATILLDGRFFDFDISLLSFSEVYNRSGFLRGLLAKMIDAVEYTNTVSEFMYNYNITICINHVTCVFRCYKITDAGQHVSIKGLINSSDFNEKFDLFDGTPKYGISMYEMDNDFGSLMDSLVGSYFRLILLPVDPYPEATTFAPIDVYQGAVGSFSKACYDDTYYYGEGCGDEDITLEFRDLILSLLTM